MRIVSLLPSATEVLFELGLGDAVVGVSHECDYPVAARKKPAMIKPRVDPALPSEEIDARVRELVARGESLYQIRDDLLRELRPDLIITQDLCHVCAASPGDLGAALSTFHHRPQVLTLSPESLMDVWEDVRRVGHATGCGHAAEALAQRLHDRVESIYEAAAKQRGKPRVACIEWLSPVYVPGHWVPEMIESAKGLTIFGCAGQASFAIAAEDVLTSKPEVIVIMPCGFSAKRAFEEFRSVGLAELWKDLPAFRHQRVFSVDANSYFSRPGPRLVEGVAILAHLFHPGLKISVPAGAYERYTEPEAA
jgi:iron complex transport system substrate-binding protein